MRRPVPRPAPRHCLAGLAGFAAALLWPLLAAAQPEKPQLRLTLDGTLSGSHAAFVLAVDGGALRRHGLDVQIDRGRDGADAVRRVAAGEFEVGVADLNLVIAHNARQPGRPLTAFYVVQDRSPLAVISLAATGIRTPADLRGKVLGAAEGEAARTLFPLFGALNGLQASAVRWAPAALTPAETQLTAGTIDGVTADASTAPALELLGVRRTQIRVMRYADHGVALYGAVLFARADFLDSHPHAVSAFTRGINDALRVAIVQPAMAIEALRRRLGAAARPEVELLRLRAALDDAVLTTQVRRHGLSQVDWDRLQRSVDLVVRGLRLPRAPRARSLYTEAFLPPRDERQVALTPGVRFALSCPRPPPAPAATCR